MISMSQMVQGGCVFCAVVCTRCDKLKVAIMVVVGDAIPDGLRVECDDCERSTYHAVARRDDKPAIAQVIAWGTN